MRRHLIPTMLFVYAAAFGQTNLSLPAPGSVTLPLDEYNKLVEQAAQPPKPSDAPPVPYVLKSVQMNLQVAGDNVTGSILIEGEVLAKGNYKVPLVGDMVILDAHQNGADLPVDGGAAVLSGPGEFSVTLQGGLPLTIDPNRASFTLPVPAAGAVRLSLSVPGEETQLVLSPGLITNKTSQDGHTTIEGTLRPGKPVVVSWASRLTAPAAPAAPKELRFTSDVKTLISVDGADLAVAALGEITVMQGYPLQLDVRLPDGYEVTGATGPTLMSSNVDARTLHLVLGAVPQQTHQFLISLARTTNTPKAAVPLVSFQGSQRETGEVLVEGEGAMELTASEQGGLRRMDVKETDAALRSMARAPLHAAFRYQKKPSETPAVALEWVRFPDSSVLSAVAQQADVTTLVTSEGRSLTEVKLTIQNHAQPFLKVSLPAGATILSCDVAGEKVKPVTGADGNRVPLLRPGFRPTDAYTVSFVFVHAGTPFAKRGGGELSLPKMDLPIGLMEWEVFLPQRYKVADFGGDAISARLLPFLNPVPAAPDVAVAVAASSRAPSVQFPRPRLPGQIGGVVTDPSGAVVAGAHVAVTYAAGGFAFQATADRAGRWLLSNIPSGRLRITVTSPGFQTTVREFEHDASRSAEFNLGLSIGSTNETVTVMASTAETAMVVNGSRPNRTRQNPDTESRETQASVNVADLQRRVAGVLPIGMSVPRTGLAYRFVRPLVLDEETRLTFTYRSK